MIDEKAIVEMYDPDFAAEYDKTVLQDYKYTAPTVMCKLLFEELPKQLSSVNVLDLGCWATSCV